MKQKPKPKTKAHECYGIVIDGVRHEVDEFTEDQIGAICDDIDERAKTDEFIRSCRDDAEGDDNTEYLCEFLDKFYKRDLTVDKSVVAEMALA